MSGPTEAGKVISNDLTGGLVLTVGGEGVELVFVQESNRVPVVNMSNMMDRVVRVLVKV